ncbi:hypothetical protein V8C43DRAFT_276943 [Trichoderma afarasin]|uniref:Uncharacterized protein n=2 Tax=Trichoderma TaxID=5543 RepID=A0A2T4AK87_TRIHA|nr:hypothetical protein M431DRAFT_79431 [Trichoderma harzianum CBS 226.95]XP_056033310.1 hypothetical protein T069G_00784 [Trichoderma breve]KAJ4864254.1 hypothetical protein T069G_00784 [Trichoderma breve]KAK0760077.1 hypothetical protein N5P37_007156 [Trichoderma harzianum]PTB57485.1 hypothetical protein M431DRAFT_79431 [Trichoderma harzianum CBS 226.95]
MNRLPPEIVDAILLQCVEAGPKNSILDLRLVCRAFDRILKPYACRTLELEFSRLSKTSRLGRPRTDALQTVGYHCKSLYIDLMVLRDEMEVDFLNTVFARVPWMMDFCQSLQNLYCMGEMSFTEQEYYDAIEALLFNCREVERLRLSLPFQLVGRHCNAATIILANTFKALASRPEEDSASMKVLVLENVTDIAVCHLWMNPSDVMNIMRTVAVLEHLVIALRRHETDPPRVSMFGSCFWNIIEHAQHLVTLCIIGMEHDDRPPRGLKQTRFYQMPVDEWRARVLPPPRIMLENLTSLELKRVEISPDVFQRFAEAFGALMEELYLNEVYLKTEQSRDWNENSKKVLWVGIANQRPEEDDSWMAMMLRCTMPNLRICRASFLAYDLYIREDVNTTPEFDLVDPCGLARSLSQRFVEVVMGICQPPTPSGEPVEYLPQDSREDYLLHRVTDRPGVVRVTDYDTNAYQTAVENTTSGWQKSIDGVFTNCNPNTLDELHYIAETACQGMNEIHRRRNEWTAGNSLANEYTHNLLTGVDDPSAQLEFLTEDQPSNDR